MDLSIRTGYTGSVVQAVSRGVHIAITTKGHQILLDCDLTCHETCIAGTDQDENQIEIPYSDIDFVAVQNPTGDL